LLVALVIFDGINRFRIPIERDCHEKPLLGALGGNGSEERPRFGIDREDHIFGEVSSIEMK